MSEFPDKDVFERMVERVLAYRPKKAKRKKKRKAKKKQTQAVGEEPLA